MDKNYCSVLPAKNRLQGLLHSQGYKLKTPEQEFFIAFIAVDVLDGQGSIFQLAYQLFYIFFINYNWNLKFDCMLQNLWKNLTKKTAHTI